MELLNPSQFPELLKEINDPPPHLYIKGTLPKGEFKYLCVVGTRKPSSYGIEVCEKLISQLSGQPIIIVSGLAIGIDAIAHKAALKAGLKTIAIPGSGLDNDYIHPRSNFELGLEIIDKGGCLLSEFPPDTPGYPANFPIRNRIMAGMCQATLVIEASLKSGTMITAKLATQYNRDVLTIPGSIFSGNSEGPNFLLRMGATPITSVENILEALHLDSGYQPALFDPNKYLQCGETERKVIEFLKNPTSKEELLHHCKNFASVSEINVTLSLLEIKGFIKETLGEIHLA
jgi:DNA processing protein